MKVKCFELIYLLLNGLSSTKMLNLSLTKMICYICVRSDLFDEQNAYLLKQDSNVIGSDQIIWLTMLISNT